LLWRHLALMGPGLWHLSARQRAISALPRAFQVSGSKFQVCCLLSVVSCQPSPPVPAAPPARQQ
jgi:hypothetical protein